MSPLHLGFAWLLCSGKTPVTSHTIVNVTYSVIKWWGHIFNEKTVMLKFIFIFSLFPFIHWWQIRKMELSIENILQLLQTSGVAAEAHFSVGWISVLPGVLLHREDNSGRMTGCSSGTSSCDCWRSPSPTEMKSCMIKPLITGFIYRYCFNSNSYSAKRVHKYHPKSITKMQSWMAEHSLWWNYKPPYVIRKRVTSKGHLYVRRGCDQERSNLHELTWFLAVPFWQAEIPGTFCHVLIGKDSLCKKRQVNNLKS